MDKSYLRAAGARGMRPDRSASRHLGNRNAGIDVALPQISACSELPFLDTSRHSQDSMNASARKPSCFSSNIQSSLSKGLDWRESRMGRRFRGKFNPAVAEHSKSLPHHWVCSPLMLVKISDS